MRPATAAMTTPLTGGRLAAAAVSSCWTKWAMHCHTSMCVTGRACNAAVTHVSVPLTPVSLTPLPSSPAPSDLQCARGVPPPATPQRISRARGRDAAARGAAAALPPQLASDRRGASAQQGTKLAAAARPQPALHRCEVSCLPQLPALRTAQLRRARILLPTHSCCTAAAAALAHRLLSLSVAEAWLNDPVVREAIHAAPVSVTGTRWMLCSDRLIYTADGGSMLPVHKELTTQHGAARQTLPASLHARAGARMRPVAPCELQHTPGACRNAVPSLPCLAVGLRALIYSGDHDAAVPHTGRFGYMRCSCAHPQSLRACAVNACMHASEFDACSMHPQADCMMSRICTLFAGSEAWTAALHRKHRQQAEDGAAADDADADDRASAPPAWRAWFNSEQPPQVAGYVVAYPSGLSYATIKGAGERQGKGGRQAPAGMRSCPCAQAQRLTATAPALVHAASAGHMVPQTRPREALDMFRRFVHGQPLTSDA